MPKSAVGDYVERIGSLVLNTCEAVSLRESFRMTRAVDLFNEYEVNFGNQVIAIFYETQLRLVTNNP